MGAPRARRFFFKRGAWPSTAVNQCLGVRRGPGSAIFRGQAKVPFESLQQLLKHQYLFWRLLGQVRACVRQLPPMWLGLGQSAFSEDIADASGRCLAAPLSSHRSELVGFPPLAPATLEGEPPRHRGLDGSMADR